MRKALAGIFLALAFLSPSHAQSPLGYNNSCMAALVQTCQQKTTGGQLWFLEATTTAPSWVFVVDTTTAPVNGSVTAILAPNVGTGTKTYIFDQSPILFQNGLYLACSSTAPPTLTLATTCVFTTATR
jgi:hypothetical protein